jgi:hypothetical protein
MTFTFKHPSKYKQLEEDNEDTSTKRSPEKIPKDTQRQRDKEKEQSKDKEGEE